MITRYTVQYWKLDDSDTLSDDFDTIKQARQFALKLDKTKYHDIEIYGRHYIKDYDSFTECGKVYYYWNWELIPDDYIEYIK